MPHDQMTVDEVFSVVRDNIVAVRPELPADRVNRAVSLRDLGYDSLDRLDVVVGSLEDLDLELDPERVAGASTIGELVDLLHELRHGDSRER